jgi:hypothetical protein
VRGWVVSRLLRRVTRLDSPLAPSVAAERLAADLTRPKTLSFGSGPRFQGYVARWNVMARYSGGSRNSWQWQFDGALYTRGDGCSLVGRVGPVAFVTVFSLFWVSGVSLAFLGGTIGVGSELLRGGHHVTYLPFMLVPLAMLGIFFLATEVGYRSALTGWSELARHLARLLESNGGWTTL